MRSRKDRRSERVPAVHRLMLTILSPTGAELLKEIIISVDVSKHGARVRGRRTLQAAIADSDHSIEIIRVRLERRIGIRE